MPEVLTRADWGARAPKTTPTKVSWPLITITDLHWPASMGAKIGTDKATVARWLRSWQTYHMDTKGWQDIAYNVAVDLAGRVWMLRGWDIQDGGVSGLRTDVTVLAAMGSDDKATDALKASILWCFAEFERRKGGPLRRTYHGALTSTSCPGPELTAWAKAGFPAPATPTQEDTMNADQEAKLDRVSQDTARALQILSTLDALMSPADPNRLANVHDVAALNARVTELEGKLASLSVATVQPIDAAAVAERLTVTVKEA